MFQVISTTSFHSSSCLSQTVGYVNSPRNLCKAGSCQVQAVPKSSIILNACESGKFSEDKRVCGSITPLVNQTNSIGVIGGVSVNATLKFLRKLVEFSSTEDGGNPPPFVLCSDPMLSKELLSYERSYFVSSKSKADSLKLNSSSIVQNLINKRVFLEYSGAHCIVMPSHVSHSWYEEVSKGCSVPFLHMAECVARKLKEAKLKPLEAGNPLRIGVLATNAILGAGFYQEKLQNEGFEVVLPDRATMEHTVIPAMEALNRTDMEGACNLLRIALQVLLVRAVNSVILASDDMWDLLPKDDPLLKKCIDPIDALAWSTIKWARSSGDNA